MVNAQVDAVDDGAPSGPAESPGRVRTRAGGRSAKVREAVADACLAFLAEGRIDFTMVDVAERAGVSRKTLYRWWPTHEDVLVEGLSRHARQVTPPDTGAWESDVREFAHLIASFAANPVEVATTALIASRRYPEFGSLVLAQYEPAVQGWRRMVERATERGEISDEHSPEAVVNVLVAPLFLAPMMLGRQASDEQIERTVKIVLAATRPAHRADRTDRADSSTP